MPDANPIRVRKCGTMQVHHRLLDTNPRYASVRQRIEEQAYRAEFGLRMARSGCTQIPVVVHVVWKTADQNISQAQIASQIPVLNQDFRKQNADISNVPAPFNPLVADARITFALATVDPQGNPTDGVIRRETDKDSFGDDDTVKFTAQGGSDAWPTDQYLNIWVCQLSGGLLGYAQFPGGPAETDGVVITHTGFGTTGTATPPFNLGRTATHEIGHWLNLRHIWGDDGDGCGGSDFVADTPNQGGPNYNEPTFPSISCFNGPNGDMFMNYMDYVNDSVMVMFTEGQVSRMQAALDGPRSSIGITVPYILGEESLKDLSKELLADSPGVLFKALAGGGDGPAENLAMLEIAQAPVMLTTELRRNVTPRTNSNLQPPPAATTAPMLIAYQQLLAQYAQLHARGLLDAQGMQAWQQAWAAYAHLGGA